MVDVLRDVMTPDPVSMNREATLQEAAEAMRNRDIGDVLVRDDVGGLCGIVTDRDIVIRGISEGADPGSTPIDAVCSHDVVVLGPDEPVAKAVQTMKERDIRRLPIVENGIPIGIVSIGDLAIEYDRRSALGDISAAPPDA